MSWLKYDFLWWFFFVMKYDFLALFILMSGFIGRQLTEKRGKGRSEDIKMRGYGKWGSACFVRRWGREHGRQVEWDWSKETERGSGIKQPIIREERKSIAETVKTGGRWLTSSQAADPCFRCFSLLLSAAILAGCSQQFFVPGPSWLDWGVGILRQMVQFLQAVFLGIQTLLLRRDKTLT